MDQFDTSFFQKSDKFDFQDYILSSLDEEEFFEDSIQEMLQPEEEKLEIIEIDASQVTESKIDYFKNENEIFFVENNIFLFIDSEYEGNKYISLQVLGAFYLNNKFEIFSFIVFK